MRVLAILMCLLAAPLWAQTSFAQSFPAQFAVTGVADNDVLNIRAEPRASAELIGTYWPYAVNIEVLRLSDDRAWGLVALPEGNGWVSMRYLERQTIPAGELPLPLICVGTEPFWSLGIYPGGSEFNDPETGRIDIGLTNYTVGNNGVFVRLDSTDRSIHLITRRGWCTDGMSDREFGWSATMFMQHASGSGSWSGCCTYDGN